MSDDNGYIFRGGYVEDPAGDKWWSADLLKRVETERDALRAEVESLREQVNNQGHGLFVADIELKRARAEMDELRSRFVHAELSGAQKALDAVVKMLESCNDRIVPIGWDETAWERFCLHRYGAADDVRAMKPEDILTKR